jgi:hypothetical protein
MEEIKTGGKLPIDIPACSTSHEKEEIAEPLPEFSDIPEYDTHDFEEVANNKTEETLMSPEDLEERRKLLRKMHNYQRMFKDEVKDLPLSDAPNMSLTNLRNLADDTEFMVATRKSSQASRTIFLSACTITEGLTKPIGIKLNGLTNVCAGNEELLSTIDELAIKYESDMCMAVEHRFMLQMGQLCFAIHSHNKTLEAKSSDVQEQTPEQQEIKRKNEEIREKLVQGL